ncbi:MAG: hypothetical protein IJ788_07210 [Oscillospiraceae bacterium]|nr:hypothetical protein [Oscillospiraceae bacterium]
MKKRNFWKIPTIITAVIALILVIAIPVTSYYATMINAALGAETQRTVPGENSRFFFWTDFETEEELVAHDWDTCCRLEEEGAASVSSPA